jgi:hypothetical protein
MDLSEMQMNIAMINSNMPIAKRTAIEFHNGVPAAARQGRLWPAGDMERSLMIGSIGGCR